jgi:hypothetical protein
MTWVREKLGHFLKRSYKGAEEEEIQRAMMAGQPDPDQIRRPPGHKEPSGKEKS